MRIDFVKMHGLGNDFIVFDAPSHAVLPDAQTFAKLADRHTGIGFDQALVIEPARRADTRAYYRIFNADGAEVEQCGNGARCIAALLAQRAGANAMAASDGEFLMGSTGGLVRARVRADGLVSVDMGVPNFDPRSLPFDARTESPLYSLEAAGATVDIGAVSIGNPHAVLRVASVDTAPVERLGPVIESHPRFAKRTNVEFMEVVSPNHIRLRVYERGVGETLACGTGACGAVAVGRRHGSLGNEVQVDLPGGRLIVGWRGDGEPIWLTGPTQIAFEGRVDI